MRVLIAGMSSALGGMERRMEFEGLFLKSLGHEVIVATPAFSGSAEWALQLEALGLRHIVWKPYKVFERMHLSWPFLQHAHWTGGGIRALEVDFALICIPWNFVGMTMAHVLARQGIPFALAIHVKPGRQQLTHQAQTMLRKALDKCIGAYGVSVPVTEAFVSLYADLLPAQCYVTTAPNGIDTERFSPDQARRQSTRKLLGFLETDRVLVFCGRLDAIKQPRLATKIFIQLAKKDESVRLLVVGAGIEQSAMKSLLKYDGMESRAVFTGHVQDTSPYFSASDCYLSTSLLEGYSLTAAEAASSGLPLVLTDDDVTRSIYADCASVQFCDSPKASDWADTIRAVFDADVGQLEEISAGSRAFAVNRLSMSAMEAALHRFYEKVISV